MSHEHHKAHASRRVRIFVLTVSDTRTEATDTGGALCRELCTAAGHEVVGSALVKDDQAQIQGVLSAVAAGRTAEVLIATGGTGISRRDVTCEALAPLLDRRLDGFGELFRLLSFQEIGAAAMLSRAIGGLHRDLVVFAVPGSPGAVRLALERLILPEIGHLTAEAQR